jgi:hypothetical protein
VALHWLITGRTVGDLQLRSPAHRVDRETALAMYTRAGAAVTGEQDVKGMLSPGFYGDLAILSDDYFTVDEADIPFIEAAVTVVGGRIVYAVGEFEGLAAPAQPVEPAWSPIAHYGGYQASVRPSRSGVRQVELLQEAAAESEQHRRWRVDKGLASTSDADTVDGFSDPCFS